MFSHWGDLVAVHTRPLLPDPGWRRFVPAHMHDLVTLERVINVHKIMTRAQTTPNAEHYAKQRPYVDAAFDMVRRRLAAAPPAASPAESLIDWVWSSVSVPPFA